MRVSEQNEAFRVLTVAAPESADGVWLECGVALLDFKGHITFINDELEDWVGASGPGLVGQPLEPLLRARAPELSRALLQSLSGEPASVQNRAVRGSGGGMNLRLEIALNASGYFLRMMSVLPATQELAEVGCGDASVAPGEHRQLRLRMLRAETQLSNLMERWPGVIFGQRADYSLRHASPKIKDLTGFSAEEWRNAPQRFWHVVHEADAEEVRRQCRKAVETAGSVATTFRVRNLHTNQVSYVLEYRHAMGSRGGLVLGYECLWLDITRQTIAEKRLSSAGWKDTLATLTMGLAHDFGNIMSGILSLSELFSTQVDPKHPFFEGLTLIKQQSLQASQLIHRIVNLHRCKTGERSYHNLTELVGELMDLVQKVLPRRIRVLTELCPAALPVYLDGVEFRQVLLNLALNAGDAMPDRGTLRLRTRQVLAPEPRESIQGVFPKTPCVCLEVEDDGCGIPARHLPFLFDPFFTTKPLNKGSGLGLYNAHLFAEKHAGAISVRSIEGKGTTFELWLPQADFTEAERERATRSARRKVLLAGEPGCLTESTAEFLRLHEFYVVITTEPDRVRELVCDGLEEVDAVMVLANLGDPRYRALIGHLPGWRKRARTIVQVVGGDPDQLDPRARSEVDLVLTTDIGEEEFLKRFENLVSLRSP